MNKNKCFCGKKHKYVYMFPVLNKCIYRCEDHFENKKKKMITDQIYNKVEKDLLSGFNKSRRPIAIIAIEETLNNIIDIIKNESSLSENKNMNQEDFVAKLINIIK